MKNRKIIFCIHVVGITLLAFILSHVIMYDVSSLSAFAPVEKANVFEVTDLYNSILNHRTKKQKSDVIVVATDGLSRSEIGDLIEIVGSANPKVVGVDIIFQTPQKDDDRLIKQIKSCPNIVLANKVIYSRENCLFKIDVGSYFEDSIDIQYGAANLAADNARDVIRTYKELYETEFDSVFSLHSAMAQYVLPHYRASTTAKYIYYPSVQINVIKGREILEKQHLESLDQGIILIGDVTNINDSFLTPLDGVMPGIMIHAYTLNTILTNKIITSTKKWLDWMVAFIICLLFASCSVLANWKMSNLGNLFLRVVQVATIIVIFIIGLKMFSHHSQYLNFSAAMMMISMGMLASDLWLGACVGFRMIKENILKIHK